MSRKDSPGGSRVERKKEGTKKKIINTAMNLFKQQGFDATTMEQIASEADIAKGTLYNYFPVKEAIIDEYIKRSSKEKNSERISRLAQLPDTRSRLVLAFSELIQGVQAQKEIFEKYLVYQMKNTISLQRREKADKSGIQLLAEEIIELGQKNAEIRKDLPVEAMVDFFVFAFIEVTKQFYKEPEEFKAHEVIGQCADLFMNGVMYESE
ncbi:MAG: TetR/AcrR family transcriptional regulator [Firmicutes bacterium HGW-Firmicutes-14]|nr:MAG: TetR/AcrR family transcriptional regulator [Firmicutes bacterium HGW-Firmicutes-14]